MAKILHSLTPFSTNTPMNGSTTLHTCLQEKTRAKVLFVRGGQFGEVPLRRLLKSIFPKASLILSSEWGSDDVIDLIVEGPPQFSPLSECGPKQIPWAQYVGEPGKSYNNSEWCVHEHSPIFRIDTSLHHQASVPKETSFIWSPYASVIAEGYLKEVFAPLRDPEERTSRQYFLAWIASNCNSKTRTFAVKEMLKEAERINIDGFHSLGACMPNTNMTIPSRENGWLSVVDIYKNYRFVLAFENSIEPGYVSEKLVTALTAGAIPVYYGDGDAARDIFPHHFFIDVEEDIWRNNNRRQVGIDPTAEDWHDVLRFLVHLDGKTTEEVASLFSRVKSPRRFYSPPFPTNEVSKTTLDEIENSLRNAC